MQEKWPAKLFPFSHCFMLAYFFFVPSPNNGPAKAKNDWLFNQPLIVCFAVSSIITILINSLSVLVIIDIWFSASDKHQQILTWKCFLLTVFRRSWWCCWKGRTSSQWLYRWCWGSCKLMTISITLTKILYCIKGFYVFFKIYSLLPKKWRFKYYSVAVQF